MISNVANLAMAMATTYRLEKDPAESLAEKMCAVIDRADGGDAEAAEELRTFDDFRSLTNTREYIVNKMAYYGNEEAKRIQQRGYWTPEE